MCARYSKKEKEYYFSQHTTPPTHLCLTTQMRVCVVRHKCFDRIMNAESEPCYYVLIIFEKKSVGPYLIAVTLSTLPNWKSEFQRFFFYASI